jgi:hypothetical protein
MYQGVGKLELESVHFVGERPLLAGSTCLPFPSATWNHVIGMNRYWSVSVCCGIP